MRYTIILMLCLAVPALAEGPPMPDEAFVPSFSPSLIPGAARQTATPLLRLKTASFGITGQSAKTVQVGEAGQRLYIGTRELAALLGGQANQDGNDLSVQVSWRDRAVRMWPGYGYGAYRTGDTISAFHSPESAFEARGRFYFPLRVALGALGIGVTARNGAFILTLPPSPADVAQQTATPPAAANDAGPADAKVFVRAFYPGIHACTPVKELVLGFARDYPGKVRARFVPIDTPDGQNEWHGAGMNCGGVLVNGKQTFVLDDKDGAAREITFKQRMGDVWKPEDLRAFVAAEVAKAYPK
jgi:hypothetical protein